MRFICVALLLLSAVDLSRSQIKFAQIFFRHGQRFPTNYLTFPTEDLDLSSIKDLERGELTPVGINEAYGLGQNIREDYSGFINDVYQASDIIVYSGIDNRTVASALATLAGMYPPTPSQQWNNNLPWIPIPVFAMYELDALSFGILDHCPHYVKTAFNVSADRAIFNKYRLLAERLSNKTGVPIYDLDRLQKVLDGVVSRSRLTDLLPLPTWADDPDFIANMKIHEDQIHREYIPLVLPQTGAWHFDILIGAFDDFVNNKTKHKMVMYSTHDTNMLTLGFYLNISRVNETLQPTASYMAFELSSSPIHEDYLVTVYLHSKLNGTREKLTIGSCKEPCLYETFRTLGMRMTTHEFDVVCKEWDNNADFYGELASVLIIVTILLVAALIGVLWSCQTWKKKYEKLADEEQQPLIQPRSSSGEVVA